MTPEEIIPENSRKHPWGGFLYWRMQAIIWLKNEMNLSDKEIARKLSMDEMQVYLIRSKIEKS